MSEQKLVVREGYTLEVVSWENDGDNYRTKSMTFDDKETAVLVLEMCKVLFDSGNGIGNMMKDEYTQAKSKIIDYMKSHPSLCDDATDGDELVTICMDYNYKLFGNSEYYYSRVFESGVVYYSPKNIYFDIVSE